jgi:hypothetical protein
MRFRLAPMSPVLLVLTAIVLAIPVFLAAVAVRSPAVVSGPLYGIAAFFVLVCASVWFVFRPTAFVIEPHALVITWPTWTREISRDAIEEVRIVSAAEFRKEYGLGMRIGAGGLWGGFGWLKTGRETFSMWVSRIDTFVIVRVRGEKTLLITPEDAERFVEELTNDQS